jgi:hypothetical protein
MSPLHLSATLACLSLAACAGTVGGTTDPPAADTSPASSSDWSCVAATADAGTLLTLHEPAATAQPPSGDSFSVHFRDPYSAADVGGVSVAACGMFDETCASPLAQTQADDYGLATLALPGGLASFDGYLQVTAAAMPTNLVFFPGRSATGGAVEIDLYTATALGITTALAGVTTGPGLGVVRVDAHDCAGAPASGVELEIGSYDGAVTTRYFTGDGAAFPPDANATSGTGMAFAFGVVSGAVGVAAKVGGAPAGGSIGFARQGAVTSMVVRP